MFYKFALYDKNKHEYGLIVHDVSFFSAFCWYKDKVFSKKDSFYSLHADLYDIVIIGVHQLDLDIIIPLTSPFFICHLEELRHKELIPNDCADLEKNKRTQLFIKAAFSFVCSVFFNPDYDSYMVKR